MLRRLARLAAYAEIYPRGLLRTQSDVHGHVQMIRVHETTYQNRQIEIVFVASTGELASQEKKRRHETKLHYTATESRDSITY